MTTYQEEQPINFVFLHIKTEKKSCEGTYIRDAGGLQDLCTEGQKKLLE